MPEPHHLRCTVLSTNVLSWCRMLHTVSVSFLILSRLDTRSSLLKQVVSAVRILLSSSFLRHQHSKPYNSIATTTVSCNFTLVVFEMLLALYLATNKNRLEEDNSGCRNISSSSNNGL